MSEQDLLRKINILEEQVEQLRRINPSAKLIKRNPTNIISSDIGDKEISIIDDEDNDKLYLITRSGSKIKKIELT